MNFRFRFPSGRVHISIAIRSNDDNATYRVTDEETETVCEPRVRDSPRVPFENS